MITFTPALAQSYAPALSRGSHSTAGMAADRFELRFGGDGSLGPALDSKGVRDLTGKLREFSGQSNVGRMLWVFSQIKKLPGEDVSDVQSRWIRQLWEEDGWIDRIVRGQFLDRILKKPNTLLPTAQITLVRCVWEKGTDPERTLLEENHTKLDFEANQLSQDYSQQQAAPAVAEVEAVLDNAQAWLAEQQASLAANEAALRDSRRKP